MHRSNNMLVAFDVRGQQGMDFFSLDDALLCITDWYFSQKHFNDVCVSHKHAVYNLTRC